MKNRITLMLLLIFSSFMSVHAQLDIVDPDHYSVWGNKPSRHVVKTVTLSTGVTLEYAEQGHATGTPVIFLHGITDSWHSYQAVFAYLPDDIHAFALSHRGHGDSERPESGYAMKDFAADVAAFIKKFNLGEVTVVGHSMSGLIVQQFALDFPELAKAIVIIDSEASFNNNPVIPEFNAEVLKLTDPIDPAFADAFQKSTLAKPIDPTYYSLLVAEGLKPPARVWKAAFQGLLEVDYTARLKDIKCPVLVVWGDKDSFCTREGQDVFLKNINSVKLIIYENTGHALHWEEPKRFVNDLAEFVKRVVVFNNM